MGKIKVLPPHEAQKIAAGEVVERPANVLKELMENALDAGATQITVFIEDGGKKLIKIVDNGCGMTPEDAQLCIQNHATSKLTTVQDLESLQTFGFRGEALASVAAVSTMTLVTKTNDMAEAYAMTIEAGTVVATQLVSGNVGTTISIANLFYNLPARQKFLKKRETEWNALYAFFTAFCLDNPACSFALYHDGRMMLNCPRVEQLQQRMAQVFDPQLAEALVPCAFEDSSLGMNVTGAISRATYNRYDRSQIIIFVNHRCIKNPKLIQAVIKGYANILPPQRYPAACLFISIDPATIDVNIHPRKEEIQFLHPRKVEVALETMVKQTLEQTAAHDLGHAPLYTQQQRLPHEQAQHTFAAKPTAWQFGLSAFEKAQQMHERASTSRPEPHIIQNAPAERAQLPEEKLAEQETPVVAVQQKIIDYTEPVSDRYEYQLIGQVHLCYIIIETVEGIVLIDQHAAHERILYEQFAQRFEDVPTTQLLFPQLITFARLDYELLEPYFGFFQKHGIVLEAFSDHQVTVKALPAHLKNVSIEDLLRASLGWIRELSELDETAFTKKMNDKVHAMMACKAAIKAGDKLENQQMHELINQLHACPNRTTCPHGRPTTWRIALSEIERTFKRIV